MPNVHARRANSIIERLTGHAGKVTALIVAIGGLGTALLTQMERVKEQVVKLVPSTPCVVVAPAKFPSSVKLSEWEDIRIKLNGRNNCSGELGLYVTFLPNFKNAKLFSISPPHVDLPKCDNFLISESEPRCWNAKKPVVIGKGEWTYDVLLPNIERLADRQSVEKMIVDWELRDVDAPTKAAMARDTVIIEVHNDVAVSRN
jgi:hypothetical protein